MREADDPQQRRFSGAHYSDRRRCLILADGREAKLRPKSLSVFLFLAEHSDTVVSKTQLLNANWENVSVSEGSLTQCISDIRRVLNDVDHLVLRNIPRQGYMLVSDLPDSDNIAESEGAAVSPAHTSEPIASAVDDTGRGSRFGSWLPIAALLFAVVGGTALFSGISDQPSPEALKVLTSDQIPTIRIEAGTLHKGDDELLTAVIAELRVALSRYKTVHIVDKAKATYRLNVKLAGAQTDGTNQSGLREPRLIVEAVDTTTDMIFMANSYPIPDGELVAQKLALRAAAFASPAGGALSRHLMLSALHKPVEQLTRAECYAHGYDCATCSGELETTNDRAQSCLDRILKQNPNDPTAWALKTTILANQYRFGFTLREPERSNLQARAHRADLAVEAAHEAERLSDGTDTSVYWGMAQAYSAKCDVDSLRAAVRNGLAINPHDPGLLAAFGNWLAFTGAWDEGVSLLDRALKIEPRYTRRWWYYAKMNRHFVREEYEEAHSVARQIFSDKDWVSHFALAYILPYLGRVEEAKKIGRRLQHLYPGFTIEKGLQFMKVYCFSDQFLAKLKFSLRQANIPERGDSSDFNRIRTPAVKVIPINGAPIEYMEIGSGEPVLFVHGAVGDYRAWQYYEAAVSDKHRFISMTMRYFGSQDWSEPGYQATSQQLVDDVASFIETLNAGPVHLVTWSLGGTIGTVLAATRPDLVKSALHYEPVIGNLIVGDPDFDEASSSLFGLRLAPVVERLEASDPQNAARRLIEGVFLQEPGEFEGEVTGLQQMVTQNGKSLGPLIFRENNVLQVPGAGTCKYFQATTAPTLVVRGENTHPYYVMQAQRFTQCIPGAREFVLPNTTHDGPIRRVDAMTALILDMVERHRDR